MNIPVKLSAWAGVGACRLTAGDGRATGARRTHRVHQLPPWPAKAKPSASTSTFPHSRTYGARILFLTWAYRTMIIRLISTAQTGYFYTTTRVRQTSRIAQVKYDPMGALLHSRKQKRETELAYSKAAGIVRGE